MRVPLRLTAELSKIKLVGMIFGGEEASPILRLHAPVSDLEDGVGSPQVEEAILARVKASTAPIVWFGGDEPLQYAGMGHLARRIADLERTVFVETDGALLRQHVFSFRPTERMFFAVELHGVAGGHDRRAGRHGLYARVIEGIRAALLSGFVICVKTEIFEDTTFEEMQALRGVISEFGLDGWVITPGAPTEAVAERVEEVRRLAGRSWRNFSKLVEGSEVQSVVEPQDMTEKVLSEAESQGEIEEEGVSVP